METIHDEQVCAMLTIQAEVGMLKREQERNGRLSMGQINSLRKLSIEMEGLEKTFRHYPEVKIKLFIAIKNFIFTSDKLIDSYFCVLSLSGST